MSVFADEKSNEGMVPMKQPNKEGSPSAEAVEGRTSPEGDGDETTAARTLRRDTASSGLDVVRRAARQSKSVRFTALLHHITVDLLTRRVDQACAGSVPRDVMPKDNYIGGATPRPTFTRGACSVPSGCFTAAAIKMLAPGFSSLFSPGT